MKYRPDRIFSAVTVLADRTDLPARFLPLGSAAHKLLRQTAESLAGNHRTGHEPGFTALEAISRTLVIVAH